MKASSWTVTIHPAVGAYLNGSPSARDASCLRMLRDDIARGHRAVLPMAKSSWVAKLFFVEDCNHRMIFYYHQRFNILEMVSCDPHP